MALNMVEGSKVTTGIGQAITALNERGIQAELVETRADALSRLQAIIPHGASVMTGASQTLTEIGLDDLLISGSHPWTNVKNDILATQDMVEQMHLRRASTLADYYLGSAQAITESGEVLFVSASGSQLPAYAFSSKNVIWVAGVQKVVPTLDDAFRRVREHSFPLEDKKMKGLGYPGSMIGKWLIFEREPQMLGRNIHLILVNETVGV